MGANRCPECGRTFDTRRGLGVHHVRAHDSRLPNRVCDNCGERFCCEYERTYCSEACHRSAVSFSGANNPNYGGCEETTTCEICGADFGYYPSEKEGVYCPDCVESENWRDPPTADGDDHPRWSGGKVEHDCVVCGETVERYPSNVTGDVVVCSEPCRRQWLSESFSGSGHPNWKGGSDLNYGKGWNQVRRAALERDGYECVVCSKAKADIGRNPDVHHIVPVRQFVESEHLDRTDAHRLDNVVSLCVSCHRRADAGTISPDRLRELARDS